MKIIMLSGLILCCGTFAMQKDRHAVSELKKAVALSTVAELQYKISSLEELKSQIERDRDFYRANWHRLTQVIGSGVIIYCMAMMMIRILA